MPRYWVNTVSRNHVLVGQQESFVQANHGKAAPLERLRAADLIAFYSPKLVYGTSEPYQRFTALAEVTGEATYQVAISDTFKPFRRTAHYLPCQEAAIRPLLNALSFIQDEKRWGFPFRRGLFEIEREDFLVIAEAMAFKQLERTR